MYDKIFNGVARRRYTGQKAVCVKDCTTFNWCGRSSSSRVRPGTQLWTNMSCTFSCPFIIILWNLAVEGAVDVRWCRCFLSRVTSLRLAPVGDNYDTWLRKQVMGHPGMYVSVSGGSNRANEGQEKVSQFKTSALVRGWNRWNTGCASVENDVCGFTKDFQAL